MVCWGLVVGYLVSFRLVMVASASFLPLGSSMATRPSGFHRVCIFWTIRSFLPSESEYHEGEFLSEFGVGNLFTLDDGRLIENVMNP